jgi:hypothetical protein
MDGPADVVAAYGAVQQRATLQTSAAISRLWAELNGRDLDKSWSAGLGQAVGRAVSAGQLLAASSGQSYVDAVVAAGGATSEYLPGAATVNSRAFSGAASDGRDLATLLYEPVIRTKTLIKGGLTLQQAMLGGLVSMQRIVASEVADAGRGSASVAMAANRTVTGFVRVVRSGACARCVLLAGRWYRYNADFQRHRRCQCYGEPATAAHPGKHLNPLAFFQGLSRAEQDRRFTASGAQAIRDGADLGQVVNARRGIDTMGGWVDEKGFTHRGSVLRTDVYGRQVVVTSEGATRFGSYYQTARSDAEKRLGSRFARGRADVEQGLPQFKLRAPRLTPAEIYRLTEDRLELIGLLRRFGYIH